ncbi:MAG: hypothetical protein NC911_02880 [Candidatus Omnitrophica bacterium]|nr:hypothetical protein [Candidatus Omnitrophota bacterium]
MTPREIIKRNLSFSYPQRIGLAFDRGRMNDFCWSGVTPSRRWQPRRWSEGGFEYYEDEWRNVWRRIIGKSRGGEIYKPAIEDWNQLKEYPWPDLDAPERYAEATKIFSEEKEKYRLAGLPGFPFAICRYLRKMETYFQDLILERENITRLHHQVTELLERMILNYARAGCDGIFFCEDWGTQERLLVSPEMWREIFKPLFRRLCQTARESGLDVIMHSCGYNWEILDDLAEVGVSCFQFDQPGLYGLERLAAKLHQLKVCLFSPVDIQQVLPTGNRVLIENEASRMVQLFAHPHGGFIAKNYPDLVGIGVKEEWDQWAYQSFVNSMFLPQRKGSCPPNDKRAGQ